MDRPDAANHFQGEHVRLVLSSFEKLTGRRLGSFSSNEDCAHGIFQAPFFLASHNGGVDPILTYGNQTALDLFEMPWDEFTKTPSRYTAEAPERSERETLLKIVSRQGHIEDYSGVRISSSGRRFQIHEALVWNLIDHSGAVVGQAASFSHWEYL